MPLPLLHQLSSCSRAQTARERAARAETRAQRAEKQLQAWKEEAARDAREHQERSLKLTEEADTLRATLQVRSHFSAQSIDRSLSILETKKKVGLERKRGSVDMCVRKFVFVSIDNARRRSKRSETS